MVSAINAANIATQTTNVQRQEDVSKLIKYLNNEPIQEVPDSFIKTAKTDVAMTGVFEGIPILKLFRNRNLNLAQGQEAITVAEKLKQIGNTNKAAQDTFLKSSDKLTKRISEFAQTAKDTNKQYMDLRKEISAVKKASKAGKVAEAAIEETGKAAGKAVEKAGSAATTEVIKEVATKNVGKLGKFGKFLKSSGAGFMLAFSGIIEGLTEVIPTFKELGVKKGIKQIGKSAVKVVGDTAGYIGGQYAGVTLGTYVGTAICPGIGSAVGAVCGFLFGMLGSFVTGKITKKITGKSEREIAKDQGANQQANEIANNEQYLKELKSEVVTKLQQEAEMNNGNLSQDSQKVIEILENMDSQNPFAA